jgi:hypothetical protein
MSIAMHSARFPGPADHRRGLPLPIAITQDGPRANMPFLRGNTQEEAMRAP